jgi:ferritin-like protein
MLYINEKVRMSKIDNRNIMDEYLKDVTDRKTKETKQEWVVLGYYYDLVNALKGVMKKYSRDIVNEATNIDNAVKTLQAIYDDIVTRFSEVELC